MGVRISWLILARKSLLAWLAHAAWTAMQLACSMAASNCRLNCVSASSARFASLMSVVVPKATTCPSGCRKAEPLERTHAVVPSGLQSRY